MSLLKSYKSVFVFATGAVFMSCAGGDNQGLEYAPNMYHSVAYEPLKQIVDEESGAWVQADQSRSTYGEYYSSNPLNPHRMNMRIPPANTVRRDKNGFMPYRLGKDDLEIAAETLANPLPNTAEIENEGKMLYTKFCRHCHGDNGNGDGPIRGPETSPVFPGIADLHSAAIANKPEGHFFHVITHGKGRMGAHGSQLSIEERWKIVRYVQKLQSNK